MKAALVERFVSGTIDPAAFSHADHVEVAFELVMRHGFIGALARLADGLRELTRRAGHPEAYHATITTAFTAIVAERMARAPAAGYAEFRAANPDLYERSLLAGWYSDAELRSQLARAVFVMPGAKRAA